MESKEQIKARISAKGFLKVGEYFEEPNSIRPDHDHPGDVFIVVIEGSMEVTMNGQTRNLKAGDEILIPAKMIHSAKASPEGCRYIDGEK